MMRDTMLLVIEGIDGAGKGTLAKGLLARAEANGLKAAMLSFPRYGETKFAELIGQYLNGGFGALDAMPPEFTALLYAGDRFESRALILDALATNQLVILDRYVSSNVAYNAAKVTAEKRAGLIAWIEETEYGLFELPRPDRTCLIAADASRSQEMVARKAARDYTDTVHDLHEADSDFLRLVAEIYGDLAHGRGDWFSVTPFDASGILRPPEEIRDEVWARLALPQAGG